LNQFRDVANKNAVAAFSGYRFIKIQQVSTTLRRTERMLNMFAGSIVFRAYGTSVIKPYGMMKMRIAQ